MQRQYKKIAEAILLDIVKKPYFWIVFVVGIIMIDHYFGLYKLFVAIFKHITGVDGP